MREIARERDKTLFEYTLLNAFLCNNNTLLVPFAKAGRGLTSV